MVSLTQKLDIYFEVANKHIDMIQKSINYIKPYFPFDSNFSEEIEDDMILFVLDSLVFRFAKLQDWLGEKIFKNFLAYEEYPVEGINFFEILKKLEKENILDIDLWSIFRNVRNELAHDYPDYNEIADNLNFIIKNSDKLIEIAKKLELEYHKLKELKNENHK